MKYDAAPAASAGIFESATHLVLCTGEQERAAVPFSDPKVRWSRCTGVADCLGAIEQGVADGAVVGTAGDQSWVLQLLTAAQPLARNSRMGLFAWVPADFLEPKAYFRAGAAELLHGDPVMDDDVVRLWARLETLRSASAEETSILRHGDLTLDPARFKAWRGSRLLRLSTFQVELLGAMMRRPHHVFTRDELAELVWTGRSLDMSNVRTCFRRLRQVLNADGEVELVRNVRDRGYVLDPE